MAEKLLFALGLRNIPAHAGGQGRAFDQPRRLRPFSRSAPTTLPSPGTRRKRGPCAIRASFSQVCRATTGQVASDDAATNFDLAPAGLAPQRNPPFF